MASATPQSAALLQKRGNLLEVASSASCLEKGGRHTEHSCIHSVRCHCKAQAKRRCLPRVGAVQMPHRCCPVVFQSSIEAAVVALLQRSISPTPILECFDCWVLNMSCFLAPKSDRDTVVRATQIPMMSALGNQCSKSFDNSIRWMNFRVWGLQLEARCVVCVVEPVFISSRAGLPFVVSHRNSRCTFSLPSPGLFVVVCLSGALEFAILDSCRV